MIPRRVLESIALRYDTAMSRAMLRALGSHVPGGRSPAPAPRRVGRGPSGGEILWCFENHGSPMDRPR